MAHTSAQLPNGIEISLKVGDITKEDADAVVNAANEGLLGGGGVDGAIHRAAGPSLLAECREVPQKSKGVRCPTGEARLLGGYDLKAKHVIATVGPIYGAVGGASKAAPLLRSCVMNSLSEADSASLSSIAFPAISCGVYGYPADEAASVMVDAIKEFADTGAKGPKDIRIVLFSDRMYADFEKKIKSLK